MVATPASRRKFNTRGRSSTTPKRRSGGIETSHSEPPKKKRRYVPGGPGGGGRYVDADGSEIPVGGTGPGGYAYTGPRGTVGPRNAANGIQPPPTYERPEPPERLEHPEPPERPERPRRETRREQPATRPRYSSAAAAAAAVVQGDGFKPREERGWEEFHQDLDLEADFPVFSADEVDGVVRSAPAPNATVLPNSKLTNGIQVNGEHSEASGSGLITNGNVGERTESNGPSPIIEEPVVVRPAPIKRRPGRPPRDPNAMLKGIGTPDAPKVIPLPGPNPREKLTLPKPSFRMVDPFASYEKATGSVDYVDRTMANVGYQESDHFIRPEKALIRLADGGLEEDLDLGPNVKSDGDTNSAIGVTGVGRVEYDMDEQDQKWLEAYNLLRRGEQVEPIKPAIFEITMTKIEKEWHALEKRIPKPNPKPPQTHRPRSSSAAAVNGESVPQGEEQDSKCAICDDGDCENTNAIVFCDGCDLAVHQECYGVPFIPEGQWLCRKCHLIGRGTPTCIFCPNTDGAFKQTNSSKWSHLLCAIWIPEVSLGNTTFMEPVMEVEKVPKSRWKLRCSICQQAMGACIQCGNKNCFRAFHVTCGRRARWYLSMKSTHGGPASLDASVLKAFCDKHVPPDWRKTYDVDGATADAVSFYRYTMRGKIWADSQQAASTLTAAQRREAPVPTIEESQPKINLTFGGNRRKKVQTGKTMWRLPSGAPVIPSTVYDSLEGSLARFTVRKRKEFAADMCRYWTLKREAKRGAALIKRLQLQMETFSSMEMTRRNFAGMGAAGAVRLRRRIEFAEERIKEAGMLLELCKKMRDREALKLQDAETLRDIVNTIYFPISPLLWPIMDKALALDSKGFFRAGLHKIRDSLEKRAYASVGPFSTDLGTAFTAVIGMSALTDPNQIQSQINEDRATKKDLTSEDKDRRKLAKRIIKAVQGALEDANHKESELCRRPFEEELLDFDQLIEKSISSRRFSEVSTGVEPGHTELLNGLVSARAGEGVGQDSLKHDEMSIDKPDDHTTIPQQAEQDVLANCHSVVESTKQSSPQNQLTPASSGAAPSINGTHNPPIAPNIPMDNAPASPMKPPTPPLSSSDDQQTVLSIGGIPWYMEPFDPRGTSVYEERWTGRDVARGMSEELSDMDEEELSGLVDAEVDDEMDVEMQGDEAEIGADTAKTGPKAKKTAVPPSARKKNGRLKKRWRGFK